MSCTQCTGISQANSVFEKQEQKHLFAVYRKFLENREVERIKIRCRDKSKIPTLEQIFSILSRSHSIPEAVHGFFSAFPTLYQSSVADILDITRSYVCRILKGERGTHPDSITQAEHYVKDRKEATRKKKLKRFPIEARISLNHTIIQQFNIAKNEGGFEGSLSEWVTANAAVGKYYSIHDKVARDPRIIIRKDILEFEKTRKEMLSFGRMDNSEKYEKFQRKYDEQINEICKHIQESYLETKYGHSETKSEKPKGIARNERKKHASLQNPSSSQDIRDSLPSEKNYEQIERVNPHLRQVVINHEIFNAISDYSSKHKIGDGRSYWCYNEKSPDDSDFEAWLKIVNPLHYFFKKIYMGSDLHCIKIILAFEELFPGDWSKNNNFPFPRELYRVVNMVEKSRNPNNEARTN